MRVAFFTITDQNFFPGTLATVNSVLEFHPDATIFVVHNQKAPLTAQQSSCFEIDKRVRLLGSSTFATNGRYINAWELKSYVASDLSRDYDVLVGIDSDCLLCSNVDAEIAWCAATGRMLGGKDGGGVEYDEAYRAYGIKTPVKNPSYMSTSLFFCPVTPVNRRVMERWAECCSAAIFNNQGPYPGHGDQGVLNAVAFAENPSGMVELLDNHLWSQHWVYWTSILDFHDRVFINRSAQNMRQRAFHCGGAEKFWSKVHSERVCSSNPLQTYPYVWFLSMLWFGACSNWRVDPLVYLPRTCKHLLDDLIHFLPQIFQVFPRARRAWDGLTDALIDRLLSGIPRFLSLGSGSMAELMHLVAAHPETRRFVEIGGYEGGSILAMAVRFANRPIDFVSVESFMGNLNGTMDGCPLPSRKRFQENLKRFRNLRVTLVPGDSALVSALFEQKSVDFIFIDGCHDTAAVLRDIDAWRPKLAPGGVMAGDDYGWESVRRAVLQRFPDARASASGALWWIKPGS